MSERFSVRPDPDGYSVVDLASGDVVVIGGAVQRGLSHEDAEHTAKLLNSGPSAPRPRA